jgi:phenazine biosynthesis protein PhzF family
MHISQEDEIMKYYVVDAFADQNFKGNPAGVCMLEEWPEEKLMQNIAFENNLAETAFVIPRDGYYDLRWFTPEEEMDLCGHATLASAYIVSHFLEKSPDVMEFHTRSGNLYVTQSGGRYIMDFPSRKPEEAEASPVIEEAIGVKPLAVYQSRDLLVLLRSEEEVRNLKPDFERMKQIPGGLAVIVTARGDRADFVSRFFAPNAGIPEDPVTGSSHSTLIPFWAERLGRGKMTALQLSRRGGVLYCENCGERVKIGGTAVLYLQGEILP